MFSGIDMALFMISFLYLMFSETSFSLFADTVSCMADKENLFCYGLFLDDEHTERTDDKEYSCHYHHVALYASCQAENDTAQQGGGNLRHADGAVEQPEIHAHVAVALQGIGDEREGHGQHGSPGATNEQERDELHVLVVEQGNEGKADSADGQTGGIGPFSVFETGQHHGPYHTAYGLNGKENANPVASLLIGGSLGGIGGGHVNVPANRSDGTVGVDPHVHECCPAEKLHQSYRPESFGRMGEQLENIKYKKEIMKRAISIPENKV